MSRQRLTSRLDQGLEHKLTLVCAPPGYGKTTLVAQWLQLKKTTNSRQISPESSKFPSFKVGWVSLDQSDNDLKLFWDYVLTALEGSRPGLAVAALAQLQNASEPSIQSVLTTLSNQILQHDEHFVLVLDDYHSITDQTIHSSLSFLLDHLPSRLHIFLITRSEPPLSLARLRARRQMLELDKALVCCTPDETAEFLRDVMKVTLTDELIRYVFSRTEGWLVGLQLLGLSLQGHWTSGHSGLLQRNLQSVKATITTSAIDAQEKALIAAYRSLDAILEHAEGMNQLLSQLFDSSLIQNRPLQRSHEQSLNLAELIERVVYQQTLLHPINPIRVEADQEFVQIVGETSQIERVLNNLIGNAVKYSPIGSPISVGYKISQNNPEIVTVWVQDVGLGIRQEEQGRIFEQFYRVNDQDYAGADGLGLGLHICRGIVEQHGGKIWLKSQLGVDSTFCFSLPVNRYQPHSEVTA